MKEEIIKIMLGWVERNEPIETTADKLLLLFSISKRHLIENILDDVKQSHSEYAVEKIESYLDDGC